MSKIENPPAFSLHPQIWVEGAQHLPEAERHQLWCGMSLRDWFAGQALPALIASDPLVGVGPNVAYHCGEFGPERGVAALAFKYADAMLAERKNGGAA